ncbi:MAG: hypothetical protein KZQ83_08890 [gamma proteobacterium symbiont of Taylorina sp.]|nr:hypothetical protein [gamma proteobacterium symbiont of Taylorina sp.]
MKFKSILNISGTITPEDAGIIGKILAIAMLIFSTLFGVAAVLSVFFES